MPSGTGGWKKWIAVKSVEAVGESTAITTTTQSLLMSAGYVRTVTVNGTQQMARLRMAGEK